MTDEDSCYGCGSRCDGGSRCDSGYGSAGGVEGSGAQANGSGYDRREHSLGLGGGRAVHDACAVAGSGRGTCLHSLRCPHSRRVRERWGHTQVGDGGARASVDGERVNGGGRASASASAVGLDVEGNASGVAAVAQASGSGVEGRADEERQTALHGWGSANASLNVEESGRDSAVAREEDAKKAGP